ncbi:MAG: phage tail sheath family protein [Candidatus Binataceae bacterium]
MGISPTYPGIYIQELPSSAHTITAAPTSITVFVGYTHPLKTKNFNQAVELFSFTDYENLFGGLFASDVFDSNVAYAVDQFFLNGGSIAYVIGLKPFYRDINGTPLGATPPSLTFSSLVFVALEPTDAATLSVTINNVNSAGDTADVTITYSSRVETFRKVTIAGSVNGLNYIDKRINGISQLVTVAPSGMSYTLPIVSSTEVKGAFPPGTPANFATTFSTLDFANVFQQDSTLDKIPIFNLLLLPGIADSGIWSDALAFCERKQAFVIMDPPRQAVADQATASLTGLPLMADEMQGNNGLAPVPKSTNGAIYFPYLKSEDPLTGNIIELPPSGFVSGIYSRTDLNRGVWKAPAGLETNVLNTTGVVDRGRMTDPGQGALNIIGVNCLRSFPTGTVVFGARTLVGADDNTPFQQWKYVPVRRMALFIEQTLYENLKWVIFEPNDDPLWTAIRTTINNFMLSQFNQGAFQGDTPSKAFQVKCDSTTTTQDDINNGIVNIIVAFAPLKPAEFVIIKIAQLAGQVQQ